ncbi:MAG: serine/threonine protein kinase, partial [Planctomycetota bacterium]|nr:serine/threonine protein kinase [Planctomycetota bacterium]
KLLFSSRAGEVTVISAGPGFKPLGTNALEGQLMASPAVWRESLIYRTDTYLYRIADKASARR